MLNRFLSLDRMVQRGIIGSIFFFAFLVNIGGFKSSHAANVIAYISIVGAWLSFGMLRPTILFVKVLLGLMLFCRIFLSD